SAWSLCSSECNSGVQTRERFCTSPPPQHGGRSCPGPHIQTADCDGGWGSWSNWTQCTKSCGGGVQSRRRYCDSPTPEGEGNYCEGLGSELKACNTAHCPVSGSWCDWSTWTPCSRTCGAESVSRYRSCGCPEPKAGGQPCPGEQEIHNAGVLHCHPLPGCYVDGGWGQWAIWSSCSVSCGGGVHFRRRQCDNPSPQSGGRGCLGIGEQQRDCNTHLCTGIRACSLCSRWFSLFTHFVKLNMMSACYFLETGFLPMQFTDSQKCMLLLSETLMRMYHFVLTLDTVGPWRPWSQWSVCSVMHETPVLWGLPSRQSLQPPPVPRYVLFHFRQHILLLFCIWLIKLHGLMVQQWRLVNIDPTKSLMV
uniref:PROP n=1 Tax=Hippocampus comes TaxID=109280 RepID=A0A3Q2Y1R4_HIPCM